MNAEEVYTEPTESSSASFLHAASKELTLANAISVLRPLFAYLAVKENMEEHPFRYASLMAVAFLGDGLDGLAARKFGGSPNGDMVDILSDRVNEQIMMRDLTKKKIILQDTADLFLIRGIITDAIRVGHKVFGTDQGSKSALGISSETSTKNPEDREERIIYAVKKGLMGIAAPFSPGLSRAFTQMSLQECIERGVPVIINPINIQLVKKGIQKVTKFIKKS